MKIVVITGCLGFIGQHVTTRCLEAGWQVYGYDKMAIVADRAALIKFEKYDNFKFYHVDIGTIRDLPDCEYVINLAAESHVGNSIVENRDFVHTNVEGVRNLLELIRKKPLNAYGKPRLVHFSTDEVYGDLWEGSFSEDAALNPSNPYSASKAAGDMLVKAWARTYGVEYNLIRPTNNYGKRQYPEKLIPLSVKLLSMNKKISLHNRGMPIRSWLHVDDTVDALMTILSHGAPDETYNVGGQEEINKDIVRAVVKEFHGTDDWENHVDYSYVREGQDVRYSVDDQKLRSLGWSPKRDVYCSMEELVNHFKLSDFRW